MGTELAAELAEAIELGLPSQTDSADLDRLVNCPSQVQLSNGNSTLGAVECIKQTSVDYDHVWYVYKVVKKFGPSASCSLSKTAWPTVVGELLYIKMPSTTAPNC